MRFCVPINCSKRQTLFQDHLFFDDVCSGEYFHEFASDGPGTHQTVGAGTTSVIIPSIGTLKFNLKKKKFNARSGRKLVPKSLNFFPLSVCVSVQEKLIHSNRGFRWGFVDSRFTVTVLFLFFFCSCSSADDKHSGTNQKGSSLC